MATANIGNRQFARGPNGQWIQIVQGSEIRRTANALREIDASLPTKLRKELRLAAKPMIKEAKANIRALPVKNPDRKALRRKIARGVTVQASTGRKTRIRIVTKMPDRKEAMIPRGLNSPEKGFRHPVFGRETMVTQKPLTTSHWFMDAMQGGQAETAARIRATLEEAAQFVASRGGHV